MQAEASFEVLQDVDIHYDAPKPELPNVPQDKPLVETAFDPLKAMAVVGCAAFQNIHLRASSNPCESRCRCFGYTIRKIFGVGVQHRAAANRSTYKQHRGWISHLPHPPSVSTIPGVPVPAFCLHSAQVS